ncbi:hypothetical protein V8C34DRAFT_200096 [Trichoderma compactum]
MSHEQGIPHWLWALCCLTRGLFIARFSATRPRLRLAASFTQPPRPAPANLSGSGIRLVGQDSCIFAVWKQTLRMISHYSQCHGAKSASFGLRSDRVETPSSPGLVELRTRAPCWTDLRSGGGRWPPVTPRRRATNALR